MKNYSAPDVLYYMLAKDVGEWVTDEHKYVIDCLSPSNACELVEKLDELGYGDDIQDCKLELRTSYVEETDVYCETNRHYDSKSVSMYCEDLDKWVGYTFWYGGGKYGEPDAIEWIDGAYFLEVQEKEVVVTQREYKRI